MEVKVMNQQEEKELMEELGKWGRAKDVEDATKFLAKKTKNIFWVECYKSMVGAKAYGKETYWKMADGILMVLEQHKQSEQLKEVFNMALEMVKD